MPIEYHTGDLLESGAEVIAHGCNCFNTMGAGVAKQITAKYPDARRADLRTTKGDRGKLGYFSLGAGQDQVIVNCYIQYRYGRGGPHLNLTSLLGCMCNLNMWLNEHDPDKEWRVAMPRTGCGLAGGKWEEVSSILEIAFPTRTIEIWSL